MPLDAEYEDKTRYTAPKDMPREPKTYSRHEIAYYVLSWIPDQSERYTIEEVTEILKSALLEIEDEEFGLDAVV